MRIMHHQGPVGPSRPGDTRKAITAIIITAVVTGLLVLAMHASGAPLPPFPTVTRPAPLLSPKAIAISSGAMAGTPMVRFTPASGGYDVPGLAPAYVTFETNTTIVQIDGSTVQRDVTRVFAKQRVGRGIRVEYTDGVPAANATWEFLADWGPYVEEQIILTERRTDPAFRPKAHFYRVVEYAPSSILRLSGSTAKIPTVKNTPKLNPAIKELQSFRVPKK